MANEIENRIRNLKPPSKLKYIFFGFFAFIGDVVDIIGSLGLVTGVAPIVSFIVDLIVDAILLLAGWRANSKIKAMAKLSENIGNRIQKFNRRLRQVRSVYAKSLRLARRIPALRQTVSKAALALRSLRMKISRNPLVKNIAAAAIDIVPVLDLLPARTVGIYLTYRDEKKSFEETVENLNLAVVAENQMNQLELEAQRELMAA